MSDQARLVYEEGERSYSHALLDGGTWQLRIGTDPSCEIQIGGVGVQGQHCSVWAQDGKVFVEDLGSEHGTFVNDALIDFPSRLRPGMTFRVGTTTFELIRETHGSSPPASISSEKDSARTPRPAPSRREAPDRTSGDQTIVFQSPAGGSGVQPRPSGSAFARIALLDPTLLGRDVDGPGRIDDVQISRNHAELRRHGNEWVIQDAGSTNGTFVNGERVEAPRPIERDDVIALGPVLFRFTGRALQSLDSQDGIRVDVLDLTKTVRNRDTGRPLNLIDAVSMSVLPGEFVAILGTSGCGKSTFVDAVNGRRRATAGRVLFNGRNLYEEFPSLKRRIGHVPQDVLLHRALSVEDGLRHASRLRLPTDTTAAEIQENIHNVLEKVGLSDRKRIPIGELSGGQQKRVSIAMELLSKPTVLFLDEVTSGLDVNTEREMMALFRTLADGGITVFCITHNIHNLSQCHHLAYFFKGKLAFFGPETEFRRHFSVRSNAEAYQLQEDADPAAWAKRYEESLVGRELLGDRLRAAGAPSGHEEASSISPTAGAERGRLSAERFGTQTSTLTRRYAKLLLADRLTLGVTIALSPITAVLIACAAEDWSKTGGFQARTVAFMTIVTVFFLGLFTSTREIVKELSLYLHERMIGMDIMPYLVSKCVPLALINVVQVVCLLVILRSATDLSEIGNAVELFAILLPVSFVGTLLGLVISSAVQRVEAAVSLMIFVIVPQLLFSGNFAEVKGSRKVVASALVTSYWALDSMDALNNVAPAAPTPAAPQPLRRTRGGRRSQSPPVQPPAQPLSKSNDAWFPQTLVIWGQCSILYLGAFFLLLRRDGPGSIPRFLVGARRVIQAQRTDDRVNIKEWFSGAGAGLRKS